jgi:hypothetical protein
MTEFTFDARGSIGRNSLRKPLGREVNRSALSQNREYFLRRLLGELTWPVHHVHGFYGDTTEKNSCLTCLPLRITNVVALIDSLHWLYSWAELSAVDRLIHESS